MLRDIALMLAVFLWGLARVGYAVAEIIRALNGEPRRKVGAKAGPHSQRRRG
ncbi:hypothetical protein SAMN05421543_1095 [Alicyclobacillus macrosporangiidus]|uniref:Uncharacterized protein n=1 Tax=Alicyclobacillus macrosporangiidus TaxID=392015 RepID=A0A1I7J8Q2_9BACL|nr:hypothetical protein SAMN05421543_1095 [Alicyclobacillus macrosporangiidus]